MNPFTDDVTNSTMIRASKGEGENSSEEVNHGTGSTDASKQTLSGDRDVKTALSMLKEREDWTSNPLDYIKADFNLFKEDFHLLKEDLANAFKLSPSKQKDGKTTGSDTSYLDKKDDKATGVLSLFKEDLNLLKEDLSNVFKLGLSKDKSDNAATKMSHSDGSLTDVLKIKGLSKVKADRTANLATNRAKHPTIDLNRNGLTSSSTLSSSVDKTKRQTSSETLNAEDSVAAALSETCLSKGNQTDVLKLGFSIIQGRKGPDSKSENKDYAKSKECSMALREDMLMEFSTDNPWMSPLLESPRTLTVNGSSDEEVIHGLPGGKFWTVKNYACYLTLDPNSAHPELLLSDKNRRVTRLWMDHRYPDHPERFENCPQVLCREGFIGEVYWEVEWNQGADIGVAYSSISRDADCGILGYNDKSWSLECSGDNYTPCHNNRRSRSSSPKPFSHRVGVYVDWPRGTLSFFSVTPNRMTHLHTFNTTFTEPLYPCFWVWDYDSSVTLCQVELEWERMLQ